ncbi:hypothetical protein GCM10025857_36400 [Alicyclobacillus contaminans]|uniref:hypothetical protein n=1 Tax=Alicyclobacillus contaminans TaxID=392016 RepID=UPI000416729B|nr:hypothetical protein [Alicyclobacillus contaminans]GMA52283.1 hypothetical protein GCM10025857_36400 [Alicyclobacillus contaminans]
MTDIPFVEPPSVRTTPKQAPKLGKPEASPRKTKQTAPVSSLVDVDSPDDFRYEGRVDTDSLPSQQTRCVPVDNPDDLE